MWLEKLLFKNIFYYQELCFGKVDKPTSAEQLVYLGLAIWNI